MTRPLFLLIVAMIVSQNLLAADENRLESCRKKLIQAQKLGVLHDMEWKRAEPRVVAGPTFFRMPIDAKEGFVETLNCFFMGGETGKCINFNILHWQTGKPAARFSWCKLKMN